jgi:hypothetical protein
MHAMLQDVQSPDSSAAPLKLWEEPPSLAGDFERCALPVPRNPDELAPHYDLTLSHPAVDMAPFAAFGRWLAGAATARGLSCALLHDGVVGEALRRLDQGRLTIGFHLDYFALWHVADDPYARLAQAVQDTGGRPINPPARSRIFTDKAAAHAELAGRGLGVPDTMLVRPWISDRYLTAKERGRLRLDEPGARVYIKPANGFGSRGVIRVEAPDEPTLTRALSSARDHDRRDTYLLQREVLVPWLVCDDGIERPAYWRVLHCLGELLPFWWCKQEAEHGRPSYRRLTSTEIERHRLQAVLDYAADLADISGLDWFSTELCLSDGPEKSRHLVRTSNGREWPVVAIDYINDQCDVDVQSRWLGAPPDDVVHHAAERFAEAAWERRQTLPLPATFPFFRRTAA